MGMGPDWGADTTFDPSFGFTTALDEAPSLYGGMWALSPPPRRPIPSLRICAESILKLHVSGITDIGDCSYDLIKNILALFPAEQLHLIETRSPHISEHTGPLWKKLCVKDFVNIRIQVEDGTMKHEPASWRDLHVEETKRRDAKMEAVQARMRTQYKGYSEGRATTNVVDGVQMAKRRKIAANMAHQGSRPKSLMQKARAQTAQIRSIYTTPRHQLPPSKSSSSSSTTSSSKKEPAPALAPSKAFAIKAPSRKAQNNVKLTTTTKTVKWVLPGDSTSGGESVDEPPPNPRPNSNKGTACSPPPISAMASRPIARLPSRPPTISPAGSPPPSAKIFHPTSPMIDLTKPRSVSALSPPPISSRSTVVPPTHPPSVASQTSLNSLFLKPRPKRK
ncbi:BQ5605_C022g09468 [Microbotryum silenes-dioicae]|uniref:BQ5605_C022g09468 protein n=1 Tax=Microbotryum silenes-dioicae TaxID=796604 RepID=A0A2X0MNY3_9BASI|nr:BQ5605_C022g09468 [Microbotryum silenes-dioicae]